MKSILLFVTALFVFIGANANTAGRLSQSGAFYFPYYSSGVNLVRMDFKGDEVFALLSGQLPSDYHFIVDKEVKGSRHMSITIQTKQSSKGGGHTSNMVQIRERRISLGHYVAGRWAFTIFVNGNKYFEIIELKY